MDELDQTLAEGGGRHLVGVASKTGVLPAGIDGILAGVPEPAEPRQMLVSDSVLLQRNRELILAELRIPARFRDRADIDKLPDAVRLKRLQELLEGQRGVTDGEDRQGFT